MLVADGLVLLLQQLSESKSSQIDLTSSVQKKRQLKELEDELRKVKKRAVELEDEISAAKIGREESDERSELLLKVAEEQQRETELKAALVEFKDCDPALIDAKEKAANIAKAAANRWTDNIFCLQSYCNNKYNIASTDFCKHFGVPEDLDNLA
ncbi:Meiotic nuclear division protein 1 [Entophlyctis luteolus]|nr:Meiotic nuclear division protein 1 [Entophlyctis luteolus]